MSINTRPPRSVVVLGGALDAVNVILAGTSDCCNLPCRGVWNWGVAAGSAPGWPGQSARYCPKQRGMEASCRPWSRWRSGCAPAEPRRSCKFSWTWISGSGTRFWPVKKYKIRFTSVFFWTLKIILTLMIRLIWIAALHFYKKTKMVQNY